MGRKKPVTFSYKRKGKKRKKPYPIFPSKKSRLKSMSLSGVDVFCPRCGKKMSQQSKAWLTRKGETKCPKCGFKLTNSNVKRGKLPKPKAKKPTIPQPTKPKPKPKPKPKQKPKPKKSKKKKEDVIYLRTSGEHPFSHVLEEMEKEREAGEKLYQALSKKEMKDLGKIPVPQAGREIGKQYAPYIKWNQVPGDAVPPAPGSIDYVDVPQEDAPEGVVEALYKAFAMNRKYTTQGKDPVNILLQGPAGTGKSYVVREFAEETQLPYYYVSPNPGAMTSEQLLGRKEIEVDPETGKEETVWHDGVIVQAAKTGGILHIDEFSLLRENVTRRLHELMDANRRLSLERLSGQTIKAHPDLFIVLTMNPAELGIRGTRTLTQPIRRRVQGIFMDYPPLRVEKNIVKKQTGFTAQEWKQNRKSIDRFLRTLNDLRKQRDELTYIPTASEAVDFGRYLKMGEDVKPALHKALIGKFATKEGRKKVKESLRAHFGTDAV